MRRTRNRAGFDDYAFASYLGSLAVALFVGVLFVLTLDLEGDTKAAATVALLLPCAALASVVVYAIRNPLRAVPAPRHDQERTQT